MLICICICLRFHCVEWRVANVVSRVLKESVAEQLAERGADPDRVNVLSKTAFELAMQLKQRGVKAYLDSITTVRPQTGRAPPLSWCCAVAA